VDEDVLQRRAGLRRHAGRPAFEFAASKLRRPMVQPGSVPRLALIDRLTQGKSFPAVSVVAPAGYGKTTLLAQWAERSGQAFAWVSLDERDNDPKVLLTHVAAALDAVEPVGRRVFDALASAGSSVPGSVLPRLGAALASMTSPVVLVLDDVHVLCNRECRAALPVLADHVPDGSRLVLAGRDEPPLPVPRLRAEGRILEIGPRDLALTHEEASSLLREAGITLGRDDAAELHRRTEGWPTGLYLAALSLREGGSLSDATGSFTGDDRLVSSYLRSEFLARVSRRERVFLTRTAVLERMCGPLCEAVLDRPGTTAMLAALVRSNLLLVPLDRQGEWYRCHQLFRDMLLAELRRLEPDLIPVLLRRAAGWCAAHGLPEDALEYSMAAGDVATAAGLVTDLAVQARRQGRVATVHRWLRWLDERGAIENQPMLAALAGVMVALAGRAAEAERWADAADRWQYGEASGPEDPAAAAWAALLRALLCQAGVGQMRADANETVSKFVAAGIAVPPLAMLMQAIACVLSGDLDNGDAFFADTVRVAEDVNSRETSAIARYERSLVAMARGEWTQAEAMAGRARTVLRQAGIEETIVTPLACAVQARIALHRGDIPAARQELVSAQRLRPLLSCALPHVAVQARIELARACVMLTDLAGAWTLMREIDEVLRRRPGLGTLVGQAEELRDQLSRLRGPSSPGVSALTAAELRLLPMLASHLSFPEIAAELSLSRHTIKTQATSIYRKLGASTRSQAVMRARDLGLLDPERQ
jgi:LuxR family transcriptional regulator, maltose regulon positive regulatory protein